MHLITDGYQCPKKKLQDLELIYSFLDSFPRAIGMSKITPPHVVKYIGEKQEDWGISGFILIAESHISIHTFPERKFFNIDVFSCKEFNSDDAINYIKEYFKPKHLKTVVHKRGLEYQKRKKK